MPLPDGLSAELVDRATRVTALVLDVDGVLTDGRLIYDEFGDELKCFDVQDGTGLVFWRRAGFKTAVITGRKTRMMKRRVKDLGIDFLAQKALNKLEAYEKFMKRYRLSREQICAIGDDLLDLPIMRRAGLAITVPNAVQEMKALSHYTTVREGGHGAVREAIDLILKIKGTWDDVVRRYYM